MTDKRAIAAAYLAGDSIVQIAAAQGISRQRVEQIARALGLPLRHPLKGKAGPRGKPDELAARKAVRSVERAAQRRAKKLRVKRVLLPVEPVVVEVADPIPVRALPDTVWCQQCDLRVGRLRAEQCKSPWCSVRLAA